MDEQLFVRHTHNYGFRCGQWGKVIGIINCPRTGMAVNPCLQVQWIDGHQHEFTLRDIDMLEFTDNPFSSPLRTLQHRST